MIGLCAAMIAQEAILCGKDNARLCQCPIFFQQGLKLGRPSMAERSVSEMEGHGIFPLTAVLTCLTDLLIMVAKLDFLRD